MKKIAVLLSGCGVMDGSEIHEAVTVMMALAKQGASYQCVGLDRDQFHVMNHAQGEASDGERRNMMVEAARIARGDIIDINSVDWETIDGVILPGGFGAAKNLCNYGAKGADYEVDAQVEAFLKQARDFGKPIGLVCIAPMVGAKVFGSEGVQLTIGTDAQTAQDLESTGAQHVSVGVDACVADERFKVVSTPAYMLAGNIAELEVGISKLVEQVLAWA